MKKSMPSMLFAGGSLWFHPDVLRAFKIK